MEAKKNVPKFFCDVPQGRTIKKSILKLEALVLGPRIKKNV